MALKRSSLLPGEEVLAVMRLHWRPIALPVLLAVAAAGGAGVLLAGLGDTPRWLRYAAAGAAALVVLRSLVIYLRWQRDTVTLTNQRVLRVQGVLARSVASVQLVNVVEVHCRQRLSERLLGAGDLVLELAGLDPVVLPGVRKPRLLQRLVLTAVANASGEDYGADPYGEAEAASPAYEPEAYSPAAPPYVEPEPARPVLLPPPWAERTPPRGTPAVHLGLPHSTPTTAALEELDLAWRKGLITDAEYAAKRARLLDQL